MHELRLVRYKGMRSYPHRNHPSLSCHLMSLSKEGKHFCISKRQGLSYHCTRSGVTQSVNVSPRRSEDILTDNRRSVILFSEAHRRQLAQPVQPALPLSIRYYVLGTVLVASPGSDSVHVLHPTKFLQKEPRS